MPSRFPFETLPSGWYALAASTELPVGRVLHKRYFGREIALFRTESGEARAVDAFCGHLGANLGKGGKVVGETIQCPMHGFRFDGEGRCVATQYGTQVPARANVEPVLLQERNGFLLTWYDAAGRAPDWEVPDLVQPGWSEQLWRRYRFTSHPQEITENSVDFGHFNIVHRFQDPEMTKPATIDGPKLSASYRVDRPFALLGGKVKVGVEFDVEVYGLGFSTSISRIPAFDLTIRQFMCATAVDDVEVDYLLSSSMVPLPSVLKPLTRLFLQGTFEALCYEVRQDIPLWANKRYLTKPALAKGDGPIGLYRQWAQQFYPDRTESKQRLTQTA